MVKRFEPYLWEIDFNFAAMASVVCPTMDSMKITGHFRSEADYIGLTWNTDDFRMHKDAKYPKDNNYAGTKFTFSPVFTGSYISRFDNLDTIPSMTVYYEDGSNHSIALGFLSHTVEHSHHIPSWTSERSLPNQWIKWDSETVYWSGEVLVGYEDVFDEDGNYEYTKEIYEFRSGYGERERDYALDYLRGTIAPVAGGSIPHNMNLQVRYHYSSHDRYTIDFDNLWEGTHPNNAVKVGSSNVKSVVIPFIPSFYVEQKFLLTGRSDAFSVAFNNIVITGGDLGDYPEALQKNFFNVAEGYDDEYFRNPYRIIQSTVHLGYKKVLNLYVGASHYYDKLGPQGASATDHKTQTLIPTVGISNAMAEWYRYLCRAAKEFGYTDMIVSMSMENLQMPEPWKQKMFDGKPGQTGWSPATSFFSPTNTEVRAYWELVVRDFLDISVEEGFRPVLQLGEPWWWWQEFMPEDINTPYPGKPPCFYDEATVDLWQQQKGYPMPRFTTTDIDMSPENTEVIEWLRDRLGDFSNFARGIAKSYTEGVYTVLFFPPSVLDTARVSPAMRIANVPMAAWKFPNLDFIQIEDYDWVVHDNERHYSVFDFALDFYGYQHHKTHYFSGFAWEQFNRPIDYQWDLITKAAVNALSYGYSEIFIWAGSQIRRDDWIPPLPPYYIPLVVNRSSVNVVEIKNT